MPHNRFYLPVPFNTGTLVEMSGSERLHLVRVMRAQEGDSIELVNGRGDLAIGSIDTIHKHHIHIRIESVHHILLQSKKLILAQAIPKWAHLEWIVEKSTELGVVSIWLFPSQKSEKVTFSPHQQERLKALSIAAMKQCGSLWLPPILYYSDLNACPQEKLLAFYGNTCPSNPSWNIYRKEIIDQEGSILFIGPEGGFTEEDKKGLARFKARPVLFHHYTLRTETAAVTGLSMLQAIMENRI